MTRLTLTAGLIAAFAATASAATRELTEREKDLVAAKVREQLRDPDSARFRWQPVNLDSEARSKVGYVICGHVSARNAYGGYGDPVLFMAALVGHEQTTSADVFPIRGMDDIITKACRAKGYRIR